MKDASGHEHDEKGLFTGPGGGGVTPAAELKKKSTEELTKINPWDDEKTRKMKMKLAKMHEGNQAIKDDIAKRKAHIAEMKKSMGINADMHHLMNREPLPDRTVEAGEIIENVQICPIGDWAGAKGKQHCTAEALQHVVNVWKENGSREILVDFEHNAEAGGTSDTSAAAWATNLRVDAERGLVGDFRMTDVGAEAVSNRRLRFLSVAWFVNRKTREPMSITSIALTNKPNIPVAPVLNKAQTGDVNVEDTNKENTDMDRIKEVLGLAPEASEDEVLNAVTALVQKNKDAEAAALEKEADEFAEANKAKLDPKVCKAQYIANKEACKALVAAIPDAKPDEPQVILNKGKTPDNKLAKADAVAELNKCKTPQEKIAFAQAHAAELSAAD